MDLKKLTILYLETLYTGDSGKYRNCQKGHITLYSSCFAYMISHYLDALNQFSKRDLKEWANYILSHQKQDGLFYGPEILEGKLLSAAHSKKHLAWHLTCHVLPVLTLMKVKPRYPLAFVEKYLEQNALHDWLEKRNWNEAWLEGNNLLFMGQLLTYLAVEEGVAEAKERISDLFQWLDKTIDLRTGFWGTDRGCDNYNAVYGGYHQLLLYYYWNRELPKEAMIDTVLALQHYDGGFSKGWGGGSCEDVDCIDVLVNLYKLTSYRRRDIEKALRKASLAVLRRQLPSGGFVYKKGEEFNHMGMELTYAPANEANIFSTWFGVHSLLLISEIVKLPCSRGINYHFNESCSMGWHRSWDKSPVEFNDNCLFRLYYVDLVAKSYFAIRKIKRNSILLDLSYQMLKKCLCKK